ncbi:MAG: hypothetical protein LBM68_06125 [Bacteroidales bacterium]|nr:hypothetical protein [Bacteroidales bacterium]
MITKVDGQIYTLEKENDKGTQIPSITLDRLKRNFTKIKQNTRNSTLSKFKDYFKEINSGDFQHFSQKIVLIAGQTMWSNLKNKDCIPTIYLPNTRDGEQTERKSIEALEDCIAYITPKYEVCYDEILKKGIAVDTIIVCDTDLSSISQIIQDQSKYNFKLIVFSNENEVQRLSNLTLWNWQKEEVELLEAKESNKVEINQIEDVILDNLMQHFEECMQYVSSLEIPIKSYGYFLRSALNAIQKEQFEYLLMRLKNNKELERNEGGYEDFGDKNPKEALRKLLFYLKESNPKLNKINEVISDTINKTLFVVDREDIELFKANRNKNCQFITQKDLKKLIKNGETYTKPIVFYSFNGSKDFDFIYNLSNNVQLILYKQEKELYDKQRQIHIKQLETELTSDDRYKICGVKYEPIVKEEIKVSPTLEQIIERLEQRSNTAYDGYKEEGDSLLDDLEEEINYRITMLNGEMVEMQSNETVFDENGNLVKAYKLQKNKKIRIYPHDLAENLIEIAIAEEPDIYGKIDAHSALWQNALKELDNRYNNRDKLYQQPRSTHLNFKKR